MPGDYDGDGRADKAFYTAGDAWWSIVKSSTGQAWYLPNPAQVGDIPILRRQ